MTPSTLVFILFIASMYIIVDVQASSPPSFDLQETNQGNAEKLPENETSIDMLRGKKPTKKPLPTDFQEEPGRQPRIPLDGQAQNNETPQRSSGAGGSKQQPVQLTMKKQVNFENEELPERQPTPRQQQNSNFIHVFLKYYRMAIKEYS